MSADGVRLAYPLLQAGGGGSTPTAALQLFFSPVPLDRAVELNRLWHSRLPGFQIRTRLLDRTACYAAEFDGIFYAVAIWTNPVNRSLPLETCLELRRLAVAPDAPRNTPSRMLAWMVRAIRGRFPAVSRLVSYQDADVHRGTIYRAAGWTPVPLRTRSEAGHWCSSRRKDGTRASKSIINKVRWEKVLAPDRGTVEIDSPQAGPRPEPTLFPL
jgi:hypothetical protein